MENNKNNKNNIIEIIEANSTIENRQRKNKNKKLNYVISATTLLMGSFLFITTLTISDLVNSANPNNKSQASLLSLLNYGANNTTVLKQQDKASTLPLAFGTTPTNSSGSPSSSQQPSSSSSVRPGATGQPQTLRSNSSTSTTSTISVLTIGGLDLGINKAVNYMKSVCQGFAVRPGNTQVQVKYPATLDVTGDNPRGSIQTGATNLDKLIRSTPGQKIVLGYSQGAQVVGAWLRRYAYSPDAPSPKELSFILIGNPEREYGQRPWARKKTPNDTQYTIRDVTNKYDNFGDFTGKQEAEGRQASTHLKYWDVNCYDDPNAQIVKVVGNYTYVLMP